MEAPESAYQERGRREFTTLLGGATEAWPLTAKVQQPEPRPVALRQGLSDVGSVEARNIAIEPRAIRPTACAGGRSGSAAILVGVLVEHGARREPAPSA
jgi:hypothetical protein